MSALHDRWRRVRSGRDTGSALALALVFLMVFGLWIGTVLQFAATGQRTTLAIRDEAVSTYAGGGAIDGAVNAIRGSLSTGTEVAGVSTCFSLPAGRLDNATTVTVTCTPHIGSGAPLGGASTSQPAQAVLALSGVSAEGVAVAASSTLPVQGDVLADKTLAVPLTGTLTSMGGVRAGSCVVTGTVTPACATAAAGTAVDPTWLGPALTTTPLVGSLPACSTLVTLAPGIYRSAVALQTVFNCPNAVVWFKTGTYFFDFQDVGTHELTVGAGTVVVGGTASGWTPGTTAASAVPFPTAAAPTTSACNVAAPGVDLVFGGDSRLNVTGGRVQLCALVPSAGTTSQHIVLRGLGAAAAVASSTTSVPAGSSETVVSGARLWDTTGSGAVVDGVGAHVKMPNRNDPSSKLSIGPLPGTVVPTDATSVTVTASVTESLSGTGNTTLGMKYGNASTFQAATLLRDCPVAAPCTGTVSGPWAADPAPAAAGLTAAQVNGMSFELTVNNPNNSPIEAWIDGLTVSVTYTLPVAAVSGTSAATPYDTSTPATTALLKASGATAVLALHGTVYAPRSAVDLGLTGVPYPVIDRGVVVRHLQSSMTPGAGYTGPLISIPLLGQAKRRVLLTATDTGGSRLARADVTFADTADAVNGTVPTVREWSVD